MAEGHSNTLDQEKPPIAQYDRFGFLKPHAPKGSAVGRDLEKPHWTRPWTSTDEKPQPPTD